MYFITAFLGIILLAAPYVLGFSQNMGALWTSLIVGAVLIVTSILEAVALGRERWEYWVLLVTGLAAIVAPFAIGFTALNSALWTLVIIGALTAFLAWTRLYPRKQTHWR